MAIVKRLLILQVILALLVAAISFGVSGTKAAYSALLGGLVCILPSIFFAHTLFKYQGARAAKKIASSFYKGEAIKIVLSIVLFALVFIMCNVTPLAFFIAYIVVQMSYWFAPWVIVTKQNRPESD